MIRLLQFLVIEIKKKSENEIMETLTLRLLMRWSTTAYKTEARLRSEEILGCLIGHRGGEVAEEGV